VQIARGFPAFGDAIICNGLQFPFSDFEGLTRCFGLERAWVPFSIPIVVVIVIEITSEGGKIRRRGCPDCPDDQE
jgi:hypothetical protein